MSKNFEFDTTGFEKDVEKVFAQYDANAHQALFETAAWILGVARNRAPIDTGDLIRSGSVEIHSTRTGHEAVISFDTPYAVEQHENLQLKHKRGRKAKFLEGAITANEKRIRAALLRGIDGDQAIPPSKPRKPRKKKTTESMEEPK